MGYDLRKGFDPDFPEEKKELWADCKATLMSAGPLGKLNSAPASVSKWLKEELFESGGYRNLRDKLLYFMDPNNFENLSERHQQRIMAAYLKLMEIADDKNINLNVSTDDERSNQELDLQMQRINEELRRCATNGN